MNGVLGTDSALQGNTGPGTTWSNEMNFVMNHGPGAGLIAKPVDQQSSMLLLNYGCLQELYEITMGTLMRKTD